MDISTSNDGGRPKRSKMECNFGERCYRKKPEHFQEYTHSHLNELLKQMGDKNQIPPSYKNKVSQQTLIEQLEIVRKFMKSKNESNIGNAASNGSTVESSSSLRYSPPKNLANKETEKQQSNNGCKKDCQRNCNQCKMLENYKQDALRKMKVPVKQKMEAVHPYNIFLTTVKDSPKTHEELASISFPELLDPYFGELESSLQINFMVELGFLLAQYGIMGYKCKPLTLLYGQCDIELGDKFKHFLTHAKVVPPSSFGSHHTKMMVFCYQDKSVRVVVSTANLVEEDWLNRTQGLWISPKCPPLPPDSDTGAGESVTNFKCDLLQYLSSYKLPELQPWLERIRAVDMSAVKVFFIASVPGTHTTYRNNWGQLKMSKILSEQIVANDGKVIAQCSSIGSLGPNPSSWLQGDMLSVFTSSKRKGISSAPHMMLIYPSFACISKSYDSLLGGGCLPYSKKTHAKQEWLVSFLCDWYSEKRHRSRAPPHIKSYCRLSPDEKKIYYFVLTSANMSKAAWGQRAKSGSLNILSYEAGVLLVPQILIGQDYFPLVNDEETTGKVFSLPYDLPVVPYSYSDVPWFIDNLM